MQDAGTVGRRGLLAGFSAYAMWGLFPLYFPLLKPAGPLEMLAHRVVWSLVTCALLLTLLRAWPAIRRVASSPRHLALISVAAVLIGLNWGVYVTVEYGHPPWVALTLAFSFAFYGLAKKWVGRGVDALSGLSLEAGVLFAPALAFLVYLQVSGTSSLFTTVPPGTSAPAGTGWAHLAVLASAGVVTVIPLLLFATAARRVPLSMLGLLQYLTPTLQFAIGVLVGHEPMSDGRWVGFGLVWLAVVILAIDTFRVFRADSGSLG